MDTPKAIVAYITPEDLARETGVTVATVKNALYVGGPLPAMWYDACEHLAGRPLPRSCFAFKRKDTIKPRKNKRKDPA